MSLKTILKNFLNHVDTLESQRKLGKDLYEADFQKLKALTEQLKRDKDYATSEGLKDVNRRKNRYKDILPYDGSRVVLSDYPGVPGSDYINANYIKGASGSLAYIASQGPLPNTVVDFWRMIWECEVQVIVMACNEQESGKYKCECYWPNEEEKKQYGNINVELVKWRQVCPDFLVRTLKACWENEERVLCQFHYTTWPDHGVPNSVQPILELVRLIRDCQASEAVPVLVHCSAGCGRTGTICAIDYVWGLMRMGKLTKTFNLFNVIADMRRQRIAMVQTKEQYVLVHKAVASLFEQQLRVIDSHTYENLDEDGEPLILRELQPEEVLYEDIMDPESFQKIYKSGEKDVMTLKLHQSVKVSPYSPAKGKAEGCSGESPNVPARCKNVVSVPPNSSVMNTLNLSAVCASDYQATAIAQQILGDSGGSEEPPVPASRNSATLNRLCREESVKRLISGWNKAAQQLESSSPTTGFSYLTKTGKSGNELHRTKSAVETFQSKHQEEREHSKLQENAVCKDSSVCEEPPKHRSSDRKHSSQHAGSTSADSSVSHEQLERNISEGSLATSMGSTDRSLTDESHHAGKLVGKATVIRRPSIAKLKALFEKTATSSSSNLECTAVESSRRRRPLFRSHSHYVGHSRAFSVPDSHESQVEIAAASASVGNVASLSSCSADNTLWNSSHISSEKESDYGTLMNSKNSVAVTSSPSQVSGIRMYNDDKRADSNVWHNAQPVHSKAGFENQYSCSVPNNSHFEHMEMYASHGYGSSSSGDHVSGETDARNTKSKSNSTDSGTHHKGSVHQRVKQYSSSMTSDNPPVLPVKRSSSKGRKSKDKSRSESKNEVYARPSSAMLKENGIQTLAASKSENYLTSVSHTDSDIREHCTSSKTSDSNQRDGHESVSKHVRKSSERKHHRRESATEDGTHSQKSHKSLSDGKKDNSDHSRGAVKKTLLDTMYGHCMKQNTSSNMRVQTDSEVAQKEIKYMNVNTVSQKNMTQIEEKLKEHPRGAIIDLTSRKSYIEDMQTAQDQPAVFISSNEAVKLSQPMETSELKPCDYTKVRGASNSPQQSSSSVTSHSSSSKTMHSSSSSSKNTASGKCAKTPQQDSLKNLLLHSPPPKSKRTHSSKHGTSSNPSSSHGERSKQPVEKKDESKSTDATSSKSDPPCAPVTSSSKSVPEPTKSYTTSSLNSTGPASRSDPRYFPVTRQTPEDAKIASEKQKAAELRKAESHLYENTGYFFSNFGDSKSSHPLQPHKKLINDMRECYISKAALPKPYCANPYRPTDPAAPIRSGEELYGVQRSTSGHHLFQALSSSTSSSSKDRSEQEGIYGYHVGNLNQRPHNPSSYIPSMQEGLYGTTRQNSAMPSGPYPPGPPKPPRTYGQSYRHVSAEPEGGSKHHGTEGNRLSNWEGGRYLVSVASPKHSSNRSESHHSGSKSNGDSVQQSNIPWPSKFKPEHATAHNELLMSRSFPFPSCDSMKNMTESQLIEAATHKSRVATSSDAEHIYHTIRDRSRPPPNCEPPQTTMRGRNKYSDYENMVDAQRDYLEAMTSPRWDVGTLPSYHHTTSPNAGSGIQCSQSDASIYAVLQNSKSQKPSVKMWPQSYDVNIGSEQVATVGNRVYFDTLQRKQKQHVSWEQRRSHDDMDIRPPPSSRLKEQIHARRSMVELDNLEISVAAENGFHEESPFRAELARNEFSQGAGSSGRPENPGQKKPPVELLDSLMNKDNQAKKTGHTQSKEAGSFGGTLYKAFGKLTSLTKFNAKESSQRHSPDNPAASTKGSSTQEEKPPETSFNQWSPPKAKDHQDPSEQWTEV